MYKVNVRAFNRYMYSYLNKLPLSVRRRGREVFTVFPPEPKEENKGGEAKDAIQVKSISK